jgi:hypothetical protein
MVNVILFPMLNNCRPTLYYYYYYYYDNPRVCRSMAAHEGGYECYVSCFVRMSKIPALYINKTNNVRITEHCITFA